MVFCKKKCVRVGDTAQQLKVLAALLKDPRSSPSTHVVAYNTSATSAPGDPTVSSGLSGHCTHTVHRDTFRKPHTHKKKNES